MMNSEQLYLLCWEEAKWVFIWDKDEWNQDPDVTESRRIVHVSLAHGPKSIFSSFHRLGGSVSAFVNRLFHFLAESLEILLWMSLVYSARLGSVPGVFMIWFVIVLVPSRSALCIYSQQDKVQVP